MAVAGYYVEAQPASDECYVVDAGASICTPVCFSGGTMLYAKHYPRQSSIQSNMTHHACVNVVMEPRESGLKHMSAL